MRDPKRIDKIMKRLTKAWKQYPDLRLGQLISLAMPAGDPDTFYVTDEELLHRVEMYYDTQNS